MIKISKSVFSKEVLFKIQNRIKQLEFETLNNLNKLQVKNK